ncbi:DUF697 domain-containing protein [Deltaproteobacteria bacterium TL4]
MQEKTQEAKPEKVDKLNDALKEKEVEGSKYIKNNVLWSMGIGLIPFPIIDVLGTTAIQLRMLSQLSKLYDLEFKKNWGKSTIGSLLGGLGVDGLSRLGLSLTKAIPGIGLLTGIVVTPISAGASTYAVGKIFLQHFASGGTFLNFNPEKVREHFAALYEEGKVVAAEMKPSAAKKA